MSAVNLPWVPCTDGSSLLLLSRPPLGLWRLALGVSDSDPCHSPYVTFVEPLGWDSHHTRRDVLGGVPRCFRAVSVLLCRLPLCSVDYAISTAVSRLSLFSCQFESTVEASLSFFFLKFLRLAFSFYLFLFFDFPVTVDARDYSVSASGAQRGGQTPTHPVHGMTWVRHGPRHH